MTSTAQLRKAATALPEVVETADGKARSYTVADQAFAAVDGDALRLWLSPADRAELSAAHTLVSRATASPVVVSLADLNGQELNHWVRRAWHHRAPTALSAAQAAGESATPGSVGDLPAGIGRPAARALAAADITTLAEVSRRTERQLLAMHGVGPRAVRLLAEALHERGMGFSPDS